uniref:Uncharacterized protein n=1 Tax=Ascaris lumbricoides TaxID=6252 RepID=A0A0M3IT30_ASCLU
NGNERRNQRSNPNRVLDHVRLQRNQQRNDPSRSILRPKRLFTLRLFLRDAIVEY